MSQFEMQSSQSSKKDIISIGYYFERIKKGEMKWSNKMQNFNLTELIKFFERSI